MANKIRLDIVTPESMVYSEDVNMVIVRATDGDLGILPGHAPLIAGLDIWPLRILTDEGESHMAISGGFIEVTPKKIIILAESAEKPSDIDLDRAMQARDRAQERLNRADESTDVVRAEIALKKALNRIEVAQDNKKH
ncbi:F0F1 ATP synthase subunit epsilon [Selenomonadales bacterium OttesenSCG-928-I06]|nr:F0F1 ATP synthase subunit epsilon [Selenomonadales bacterium OttesenSCG-928-I06]